jgi:CheY-like chemotaxis protein
MQTSTATEISQIKFLLIGDKADLDRLQGPISALWCSLYFEIHQTVGRTIEAYGKSGQRPPAWKPDCIILCTDEPCAIRCKAMRRIRNQTVLQNMPIIVLTGVEEICAIDTYLNAGASYAIRRDQFDKEVGEVANIVADYWLNGS